MEKIKDPSVKKEIESLIETQISIEENGKKPIPDDPYKTSYKQIKYFEGDQIKDIPLIDIADEYVKSKIPKGGIHKPYLWKGNDGWGFVYRVMAKVTKEEEKKIRTNKNLHCQFKWTGSKKILIPTKGFEEFEKPIDCEETKLLKDKVDELYIL